MRAHNPGDWITLEEWQRLADADVGPGPSHDSVCETHAAFVAYMKDIDSRLRERGLHGFTDKAPKSYWSMEFHGYIEGMQGISDMKNRMSNIER